VISNIQHRTIVDMLVNRDKKTVTVGADSNLTRRAD